MNDLKDQFHELDKRLAVVEEQMKTTQANLDATLNAFRVDAERRDKVNLRWQIGLIASATTLIIAVLGLWLG